MKKACLETSKVRRDVFIFVATTTLYGNNAYIH